MKRPEPLDTFAQEVKGETAGALGRAGRRLRTAVAALAEFDSSPRQLHGRERLLRDAADALYSYVIQKELMGVVDNGLITRVYGVTPEMWRLMGVAHPSWSVHKKT